MKIKCWNGCHFYGCGKFNHPIKISFVIICFGPHIKKFNRKKQPFLMDSTFVFIKQASPQYNEPHPTPFFLSKGQGLEIRN